MRSPKQLGKLAMILLLALLLLCNGVGNVHGRTIRENSVDLHALLNFKKGITNNPPALSNWSTNTHFCYWNGVACTTTPPFRVSSLNLTGENLQGQISSSLGNLTFLKSLDLSTNNFVGSIPILGHLQQLEMLLLNNNNLTGIIPDSLTNCSRLDYLDVSVNSLAGIIPTKLGLLSNMVYINFKSNQLEGRIPDEVGRLSMLQFLILGHNRLSGEFSHAILNISSLEYLDMEFNLLGKALPPKIGDLLPNLITIALSGNTFEGHIPASLGNASGLEWIDLSNNSFTGKIPASIGRLSNLSHLYLSDNKFTGRL